jgi:hypothetical protein
VHLGTSDRRCTPTAGSYDAQDTQIWMVSVVIAVKPTGRTDLYQAVIVVSL